MEKEQELRDAAGRGDEVRVLQLLAEGVNVNAKDDISGQTALHHAARNGHTGIVQALLTAGAPADSRNNRGWTALHYAARHGHTGTVQALLTAGAPVDSRSTAGCTVLHHAAENGHTGTVQALLTAGATVESRNYTQCTPLHFAAGNGHTRTVQALLAAGADINARNCYNQTPLHMAAQNGHPECYRILLKAGANTVIRDNNNKTAKELTEQKDVLKVFQLFKDNADKELRKLLYRFSGNVTEVRHVEDLVGALGLKADEMTIIQDSKNQNPSSQAYKVLSRWMETDKEASMDKLQQELSDFGMDTLAEEVGRIKAQQGNNRPAGTSAGLPAKRSAAGQSSLDGHQKEQLTQQQLLEENRTLRALLEELQGKTPRSRGPGAKPVVLLLNDEYGTAKGGVSTIHGQIAALLASKGAVVYSTVLRATEDDKQDAATDGVQLISPTTSERDKREPCLDWLTFDHRTRYPDLPPVDFIVGHVPITSHAARQIKEQRFPDAKLVQVTHVMPEDTSHYKSDEKVKSIGDEQRNILEDLEHADVIISVGPYLHDYYKLETGGFEPHHEFLPKPSDIFSKATFKYVDASTKVVLSIGRVKGVERLKGYDLVAKSMGEVIVALPNTKWRARGIAKEDFQESRDIIQANAGDIHFTPLEYGTQKELVKDMERASVVLMPSRAEPFGLVGLEAIAAGVPVLVSHKSGLAMFLKTDPDFDRPIVEIGDDDDEAAKTLSKRIIDILKDGPREFQAAKRLKERLLASEYWAASHTKFLESFGLKG